MSGISALLDILKQKAEKKERQSITNKIGDKGYTSLRLSTEDKKKEQDALKFYSLRSNSNTSGSSNEPILLPQHQVALLLPLEHDCLVCSEGLTGLSGIWHSWMQKSSGSIQLFTKPFGQKNEKGVTSDASPSERCILCRNRVAESTPLEGSSLATSAFARAALHAAASRDQVSLRAADSDSLSYLALRAKLELLSYAMKNSSCDRFLFCKDTSIPLVSVEELLKVLYVDEKPILLLDSLTILKDEVLEDLKIDTEIIPFEFLQMCERGGMVLSRHHAEKLLNLLSTSKCDLVKCWRNSFNPDLTFFPTMLSILGFIPKRNQNHFTTQSRSIAEDLSRRESYTESGMTRLLRQPLTYIHYLDLSIYSTTIDKSACEASFSVLSKAMVEEFRQSGALFAGNFKDSSVSIEDWVELTQSGLHQYSKTWQVIRHSPSINYDRPSPEEANFSGPSPSIGSKRSIDAVSPSASSDISKRKKKNTLKLVINSHVNYRVPLSYLLKSVLASDAVKVGGPSAFESIIVCQAQSPEPCGPTLVPIGEIADVPVEFAKCEVVVIRTALNSFDWTAHHMLSVYSTHPLTESDYYLYLLDTSVVEKDFWFKTYEQLPKRGDDPNREIVMLSPKPHSSISIFGKGVVANYGNNFERPISKVDGLTLEMFEKPIFHSDGFVQHGLTRFGIVKRLNPRRWCGFADWYSTGKNRTVYRYGDIGITKALLAHNHGDILQMSSKHTGSDKRGQQRADNGSISAGDSVNGVKQVSVQRLRLSVEPVQAPQADSAADEK